MLTGVSVNEVWISLRPGSAVRKKAVVPPQSTAQLASLTDFAVSPCLLPFFSTAEPGPTLFWDNLKHWFDRFGEILPGYFWRS